jgi:hypothetical protein
MFGFRKVGPPLTTFQRVDIELLMRKTIETAGKEVLETDVVTELGQLQLDNSDAGNWLDSVSLEIARRMRMADANLQIDVVAGSDLGYPSKYQPSVDQPSVDQSKGDQSGVDQSPARILLADDTLADPLRAVMEIAYQYANHFWQSTANPTSLDIDARTTNLLPICCGLGVLASDASLYDDQWSQAGWSGWSISRSGYYTAVEIGYALALYARARGEVNPKWARALRPDSRETARKAWRYFTEHEKANGSLLFDSDKIPSTNHGMTELAAWLCGDDRAFALAAGYALAQLNDLSPRVIEAAIRATHSGDKDLVPVAARLLGAARRPDAETEARVRALIRCSSPPTSLAAIQSAAALGMPLRDYGAKISKLLDLCAEDSFALVDVIGQQGTTFAFMGPKICEHISRAIREFDDELASALLMCLRKIADNPQHSIETLIKSPEISKEALERLQIVAAAQVDHDR